MEIHLLRPHSSSFAPDRCCAEPPVQLFITPSPPPPHAQTRPPHLACLCSPAWPSPFSGERDDDTHHTNLDREMMMPQQQQQSLDLGLSLGGLTSQGSLSSSTTSGHLSPWAAALSSVVGDASRREAQHQQAAAAMEAADHQAGTTTMRASTSPDSAAALSSGDSGSNNNKREREELLLERTGSGGVRGAGSDEEDGADGAGGRKKLRLSKDQAAVLEECFKTHSTLNPKQKVALANRLGLRPRQVEVWFQNRRARTKLKQTEVDCEYLKRWCERLADENKRLEKELADLRALKAVAQSPAAAAAAQPSSAAATLTMCPSCRRVAATANNNNQQQQCHPKSNLPSAVAVAGGSVLPSHCQFFPAAVDRTGGQSTWNAAAAPLVTRELF